MSSVAEMLSTLNALRAVAAGAPNPPPPVVPAPHAEYSQALVSALQATDEADASMMKLQKLVIKAKPHSKGAEYKRSNIVTVRSCISATRGTAKKGEGLCSVLAELVYGHTIPAPYNQMQSHIKQWAVINYAVVADWGQVELDDLMDEFARLVHASLSSRERNLYAGIAIVSSVLCQMEEDNNDAFTYLPDHFVQLVDAEIRLQTAHGADLNDALYDAYVAILKALDDVSTLLKDAGTD